jgi:hypothetical protein
VQTKGDILALKGAVVDWATIIFDAECDESQSKLMIGFKDGRSLVEIIERGPRVD